MNGRTRTPIIRVIGILFRQAVHQGISQTIGGQWPVGAILVFQSENGIPIRVLQAKAFTTILQAAEINSMVRDIWISFLKSIWIFYQQEKASWIQSSPGSELVFNPF